MTHALPTVEPCLGTADRARAAIRATGIRQRHIAQQMGLDDSKLSKSLAGVRKFSATELHALARLTGVSVDWLLADGTATSSDPSPARQGTGTQRSRREAVVVAAWELFASRGYSTVKIDDIARAASMSPAAVLYYFENKNAIFLATLHHCSQLAAQSQARSLAITDPVQALRSLARTQLPTTERTRLEWATWAQFWSAAPAFPDAKEVTATAYQRWLDTVTTLIQTGQDQHVLVDTPVDALRDVFAALIDGLGIRVITGGLDADRAVTLADQLILGHMVSETYHHHHTTTGYSSL
ncbi:TetR family transcriptional regulator C-terminal domain-containing protein [Auritidibacter ignavus]|uniref:TetR family transcriptional regulator C-terminal domain-containing protein n=1 Tax=Auritidibacter ignavus TaxID=678932 RepID=UPI002FE5BF78